MITTTSRARLVQLAALGGGLTFLPASLVAQRPLDHDAYDRWQTIQQERLSRDGRWLAYVLEPEQGDATLVFRATGDTAEHRVPRGREAAFTAAGGFAVFTVRPEYAAVRQAKRAKAKADDLPKDSLGIVDLATGTVRKVERVVSFSVPERGGAWVAYLLERAPDATVPDSTTPPDPAAPTPKKDAALGRPLVVRDLARGTERRFEDVTAYAFARDGGRLAFATSSRMGEGDGVTVLDLPGGEPRRVLAGRGAYKALTFAESGTQLAFLTDRDEADRDHPRVALYRWRVGEREAQRVAAAGTPGVPTGWTVSEHRVPSFSRSGSRLFFGTLPWTAPAPEDSTPDDERVTVDVWHWQDAELQPMQLRRLEQARRRSFLAVAQLPSGRVVQLADTLVDALTLPDGDDGPYGLGEADGPYRALISWDFPAYRDVYAVDLETGRRTRLLEGTQATLTLSPEGRYAAWFDLRERVAYARHLASGRTLRLTDAVTVPLYDEEHDVPAPAPPYGVAGWTAGDRELLVYDRFDVWALDPEGRRAPRLVTEGVGRRDSVRFRVLDLDPERATLPAAAPLLLSAFHEPTKRAGFYRDHVGGGRSPERLLMAEGRFSRPRKAGGADLLLFSRESVAEFPDLWVAGLDLADAQKVSDANPQQAEYRWATVELMRWRSADGTPLEGLLYQPADFDPAQRYPLMVYFYERNSDNLFAHHPPLPHRSVIRPTFYASRGYLVFVPDIVYREGYPGESALDCVIPGVLEVIRRGSVDPARIGVQGHSWGGYQIAYMVTKTNIFRAAAAGAPVANMTSAYGGIRWESGMSRMFQYERTQSRLGASLWDVPLRYLENSPLFWLDRVETPLLILHNDHDGAVPWYQGIELFTGLRRLGKPSWLINYNGEPHWPLPYPKRRDWNIRMQQYFDHYLLDAPAPRWMVEGVPATQQGKTLGLETEW
ncbi:MAG: prolyl oligopeptidase family serine peptidase [Gemmatimonadota bacterium]|nr:prolyl oligopeptidase family serine peptidase [Gemmatimonadota bacterium]